MGDSTNTGLFSRLHGLKASPARVLVGGASGLILIGTLLLLLPQASVPGSHIGLVDALFTATSAVCVTGLVVLDTPRQLSGFGHVVVLFLVQIGGLGYMTAATFVALFLGRRMGLRNRLVLKEAMASPTMEGLFRFAMLTLKVTLAVETLVAVVLVFRFMSLMPLSQAIWYGVFHSVSAFNNAGFALFSDSLEQFQGDPLVIFPITFALITGGLGFLVLSDLSRRFKGEVKRLSLHTRLTLVMTIGVGIAGTLLLLLIETGTGGAMGTGGFGGHLEAALFQSMAARTAGFAIIDISHLSSAALYLTVMLMMIGGGSGSTAGGIKVTTFGVVLASLWSTMRGRERVTLFHRTVPHSIVQKSFFLAFMAFFLTTGVTWLILVMEGTPFLPTLFEVASAVATVGLSVGDGAGRSLSAGFSDTAKLLLVMCMFIGRLGPLTIGIAVLQDENHQRFRRPTERVLIG